MINHILLPGVWKANPRPISCGFNFYGLEKHLTVWLNAVGWLRGNCLNQPWLQGQAAADVEMEVAISWCRELGMVASSAGREVIWGPVANEISTI